MNQTSEPKVEGNGLFPTPMMHLTFPDSQRINGELSAVITKRMADHPSNNHSNLGGWQSSWDLSEWGGDAFQEVLGHAKKVATRMTCNREGKAMRVDWGHNAWANVNGPGDSNEFHTHPGAFWSGTYYVDDGGISDDPSLGGEFEIQDPRGITPAMYSPLLAFNIPGGPAAGVTEKIIPQAGTMLIFPSFVSHAVRPYRGDRQRISIAFNLTVRSSEPAI